MNVFTKRNALVGFLTLKALEQRRRRKHRRRAVAAVGLGVLSLGLLAGIAVLLGRRQHADAPAGEEGGPAAEGEAEAAEAEGSEPIPAT